MVAALTPPGTGPAPRRPDVGPLRGISERAERVPIRLRLIGEILLIEGLCWRQQEAWFGERVDPGFAEKGEDRAVAPRSSRRAGRDLRRRDRAGVGQGPPGNGGPERKGAGEIGDRLRTAGQGIPLRLVPARPRGGVHPDLSGPQRGELCRLPWKNRHLASFKRKADTC